MKRAQNFAPPALSCVIEPISISIFLPIFSALITVSLPMAFYLIFPIPKPSQYFINPFIFSSIFRPVVRVGSSLGCPNYWCTLMRSLRFSLLRTLVPSICAMFVTNRNPFSLLFYLSKKYSLPDLRELYHLQGLFQITSFFGCSKYTN